MSGTGKENAILQYTKKLNLEKIPKDILVSTSGAGGLFKSGIPIGKIKKEENLTNIEKIVDFNVDFSQLKYVKVLSFSKEESSLIDPAKEEIKILNKQISEIEMDKETIKVLLEEKKIFNDSRIKIEEENSYLKNRIISLQDEISITKKVIKKYEAQKEEIKFLELKLIYGNKCKKTFYNNLYKVGTKEYRTCVLNKGPKINE